jgi:hypothetical protein
MNNFPETINLTDEFLLALRNDLVTFWGTLVKLHGQAAIMPTYHAYCMAIDNLDPENPRHIGDMQNAVFIHRMTIIALSDGVFEYERNQKLTPNQTVLSVMRRQMQGC